MRSFIPRSVVSSTAWASDPLRIGSGSGSARCGLSTDSTSQRTPQAANVSSPRAASGPRAASAASTASDPGGSSGGGSGTRSAAACARRSSCGVGAVAGGQVTSASSRVPRSRHSSSVNNARTSATNGDGCTGSPSSSEDRKERNRTSSGRDTHA